MPHTSDVRKRKVAVLGATGTVGQRFISLLAGHPWFELAALTTSERNAGKRYGDVTPWHFGEDMPAEIADMRLESTRAEVDAEICFSALPSDAAEQWESALAKAGHHVFSNVKTHRMDEDVPLIIAEVNPEHANALDVQRRKRGWTGSIVTNGNCSAITFTLAAAPLHRAFGIEQVVVTTHAGALGRGLPRRGLARCARQCRPVHRRGRGEDGAGDEEVPRLLGRQGRSRTPRSRSPRTATASACATATP